MPATVITTFWSGPTAYLTEDNGYPLRIDGLVPLPDDSPFKGHKWAQPSGTHLSALMRHVVNNPEVRCGDWQVWCGGGALGNATAGGGGKGAARSGNHGG